MANYAWLHSANAKTPDEALDDERPEGMTFGIACAKHRLPLLWFAPFRAADVRTRTIDPNEGVEDPDPEDAPYECAVAWVEKARGLAQLEKARAWYAEAFADFGSIDEHFALFAEALRKSPGRHLLFDPSEVGMMTHEPEELAPMLRALLGALDGEPDPDVAWELLEHAGYDMDRPFPPARLHRTPGPHDPRDAGNLDALLGGSVGLAVPGGPHPWEEDAGPSRDRRG